MWASFIFVNAWHSLTEEFIDKIAQHICSPGYEGALVWNEWARGHKLFFNLFYLLE